MREMLFSLLVAVALAGIVPAAAQTPKAGAAPASKPAAAPAPKLPTKAELLTLTPHDRILGKKDAPITIIEYASLSCPHCAHFEDTVLPTLKKKWIDTGKARLVMRDYPLNRPALLAEMLLRCVPRERFYPLAETLFRTQDEWVIAKDVRAALARTALLAGVGKKEFDACLSNKKLEDEIIKTRLAASKVLGVDATPTFFVNGKKFEGAPSWEALNKLLISVAPKT